MSPNMDYAAGKPVEPDSVVPHLQRLLTKALSRRRVRHAVIGAASIDGSWDWSAAAGEADPGGTPMDADTPWLIASVTKLYIALATLRLCEQGRLDLAAPIPRYLPAGLRERLHVRDGVDRTARITVSHLLAHASGLPDSLVERPAGGRSLVDRIQAADLAFTLEEAIEQTRRLKPLFAPADLGAKRPKVRYSDTNYQLLMVICEQVSGLPMGDLYRRLLFEPLGLSRTWLPGDPPPPQVAAPAVPWLGDRPLQDRPLALRSIKDLYATAADVLRFGRALFTGEVFSDAATAGIMRRRFNRFGFPRSADAIQSPAWPIEYGLGMMRFAPSRALAAGRRLPPVIGHTGSTGSWLWYCPPLGLLLAGTVDQATMAAFPFRAIPPALARIVR